MLRLRKILLCDYLYYIILGICLLITLIRVNLPIKTNYKLSDTKISGIITNINIDGNKLDLTIKAKEKIKSYYYFESLEEKEIISNSINLGDKLLLKGTLKEIEENKTKELFNYKNHMKTKGINYVQEVEEITMIKKNKNLFYKIKQLVIDRCNSPYLKVFVLGDRSQVSTDITNSYSDLGISHLFAISGMHITLLSGFLLKLLTKLKIKEGKRYFFVSIIILFYLFLTGVSASILRSVLFFIFFSINKVYYFYIKSSNIFIIVFIVSLFINPYYIYDIAFQYSFSISFVLIVMGDYINSYKSYIKKLLLTSIISFIVSIPITIYNFNQMNFLSIIYNIIFVPYVNIIVFPLSLLTFIFPFLDSIFNLSVNLLENSSIMLTKINYFKMIFCNNHIIYYFGYVVLVIASLIGIRKRKNYYSVFLVAVLFLHYIQPIIFNNDYIMMLDVGQGDSILIHSNNKNILIDTGGVMSYYDEDWQKKIKTNSIVLNTTIPMLKKLGISKLDYLVLTHGDYDHMGEAINLVNNFKVEKVIFNCGEFNELEQELIKVLNKKKILYYSCIKELNIDNNNLYFLNDELYDNENDNSNVIYTELNGIKLLLMGDASIKVEKDIIEKYNLHNIDILKVGHHGSKTSTSKEFINEINPKYSLISVGKDNKFGHPKRQVLENLKDSIIYRTDIDGCIMFKTKNNKVEIET